MNIKEIEYMWKQATNCPHHDTNWHDPTVVKFAELVAANERKAIVEEFTKFMAEVDGTPRTAFTKFVSSLLSIASDKFFEIIRARGQS
jgi:hypothetical protein